MNSREVVRECVRSQLVSARGESLMRKAAFQQYATVVAEDQEAVCDDIDQLEALLQAIEAELEFLRTLKDEDEPL